MNARPSNQYQARAYALIEDLNARRRAAGGEVPNAQQAMKEIQRLLALSDARNNGTLPPVSSDANSFPPVPEQLATPNPKPDMSGYPMPDDVAAFRTDLPDPVVSPSAYTGEAPAEPTEYGSGLDSPMPESALNAPAGRLGFSSPRGTGDTGRRQARKPAPVPAERDWVAEQRRRLAAVDAAADREAKRFPKESSPADLDSVDAASSELTPDQALRRSEQQYVAGHVANVEREIAEKNAARESERGLRRQAQLEADLAASDVPPPGMSSTDVLPGDQPGTVRKWNPVTKRYDTVAAKTAAAPSRTPFYGRSVPGAQRMDGTRGEASAPFASQKEADAYDRRRPVDGFTPEERADRRQRAMAGTVPTEAGDAQQGSASPLSAPIAASERDIAMRARGYVPVFGNDGSVTYMLEAAGEVEGDGPRGAPGRWGRRSDLTTNYDVQERNGPLGKQKVYVPKEEFKTEVRDNVQGRAAARKAVADNRQRSVVLNAQYRQRPWALLDNPDASDWTKRMVSEALLRSGRPGATPLDVEGQQIANARRVAEQRAVGQEAASAAEAAANAAANAKREERSAAAQSAAVTAAKPSWALGSDNTPAGRHQRAFDAAFATGVDAAEARRIADVTVPEHAGGGARGPGRSTGVRQTGVGPIPSRTDI